ncbi:hypothetical protein H4W33_001188 [Kibdelosporangium phytohabitans]|nr:hypothetical protein [Kibdelosporangium phytohabitans]
MHTCQADVAIVLPPPMSSIWTPPSAYAPATLNVRAGPPSGWDPVL